MNVRRSPVIRVTALWLVTAAASAMTPVSEMAGHYCVSCHDDETKKGDLNLESILMDRVADHADTWELVVRKLNARQMPPLGKDRPDDATYDHAVAALTSELDRHAA